MLDPRTREWTEIAIENPTSNWPRGRWGHGWTGAGTKVYLFGGEGDGERFNDLWAFSTATSRWQLYPSMPPRGTNHAFAWSGGSLWILGGYDARSGQDVCVGEDCRSGSFSFNVDRGQWKIETSTPKIRGGTLLEVTGDLILFFGTTDAGPVKTPCSASKRGAAFIALSMQFLV